MANDTSEQDQLPNEEKIPIKKIRKKKTGTKNGCPGDSTACPDSPSMKGHAITQAMKVVDKARKKRGRPKKLIGEEKNGDAPPMDGIKQAIKECPIVDKARRKRGRPKKLVAQEKDYGTHFQAVVKDGEAIISHGKKSQKGHWRKRHICTEDYKTPCKKKKKITSSPLFYEPKSLQEIVEDVIMNNGIFMSRKPELKNEFIPFIVRSVPTQQENESHHSFREDMEISSANEQNEHKREHSGFVNFQQPEKIIYSENCEKKTGDELSKGFSDSDVKNDDDMTTKWYQPLSLMDACIQQLHRGVDERSYRILMNYGLHVNATDQQVDSSQQKIATSSDAPPNNDTNNLESGIDKSKQLSSIGSEECSNTKDNQNNHCHNEGIPGNRDAACNAFPSSIIQKDDNFSRNRNSFEELPLNENQIVQTSTDRKTMHNNNDTSIPVELGTSVHRNSKFASEYSDSSRSHLYKDRDEESLLAAELLTRLPHGRIVDSDTGNNVMKLSDIQPTIIMDGNNQTHYFDQQLPLTGPQLVNSTNSGPNQCCYNNMVGTENVNLGMMPDGRMHDHLASNFSSNNNHLQTVSSIPSACSAFSTSLQHSSPANNITASDILYQTNGFNPNASQQGQWNQINTRHYNYQSVELSAGDGDTLNNRRGDQGLNHLQNWNPLTSGVATSSDQMQTIINNLTNPRQQIVQYQPQQDLHPQNYNYDHIIPENNLYDARPTNHNEGYMNHNTQLNGQPHFFGRRDGHSDFKNCQISNYNSNAEYQNNLMDLQEGVHMLESISANIPDCDMMNSSHAGLQRSNPGNLITVQEPGIHAEIDNFPKSASGQMQYFQPLNVREHFETNSKNRRRSKASKIRGSIQNEPEYMDFLNEVIYKENQGSFDHALQPQQSKDVDKDRFYFVLAPMVNPAEVNDIGHNRLIARYIDYLIVENEQITEMSKSVSIPIEHCVMDDPYLMDIIGLKVQFPTAKYYQWLHTFCPNIPIDWKSLNRQMMRFQPLGDYRQHNFLIDKRPTPVLLGESFYFFQRERDRLLQC